MRTECTAIGVWAAGILLVLSLSVRAHAGCEEPPGELLALAAEGASGTGLAEPKDGIGGTGRDARDVEDGIGGTGRERDGLGGTGLFGTLTAFGSLCVNGHEIVLDPSIPVTLAGEPASADVLRVGQVLWLLAEEDDGRLRATQVDVFLAAAGPIERIDSDGHRLQVDGRQVALLAGVLVVDGVSGMPLPVESLRVGESLAVSGLVNTDGIVLASRIERRNRSWPAIRLPDPAALARSAGLSRVSVEGFVKRGPEGGLHVGSFALALGPGGAKLPALADNARVWVRGRSDGAQLAVEQIRLPAPRPAPRPTPGLPHGGRMDPPRSVPQTQPQAQPRGKLHQPPAPRPSPRPGPNRSPKLDTDKIRTVPLDARMIRAR